MKRPNHNLKIVFLLVIALGLVGWYGFFGGSVANLMAQVGQNQMDTPIREFEDIDDLIAILPENPDYTDQINILRNIKRMGGTVEDVASISPSEPTLRGFNNTIVEIEGAQFNETLDRLFALGATTATIKQDFDGADFGSFVRETHTNVGAELPSFNQILAHARDLGAVYEDVRSGNINSILVNVGKLAQGAGGDDLARTTNIIQNLGILSRNHSWQDIVTDYDGFAGLLTDFAANPTSLASIERLTGEAQVLGGDLFDLADMFGGGSVRDAVSAMGAVPADGDISDLELSALTPDGLDQLLGTGGGEDDCAGPNPPSPCANQASAAEQAAEQALAPKRGTYQKSPDTDSAECSIASMGGSSRAPETPADPAAPNSCDGPNPPLVCLNQPSEEDTETGPFQQGCDGPNAPLVCQTEDTNPDGIEGPVQQGVSSFSPLTSAATPQSQAPGDLTGPQPQRNSTLEEANAQIALNKATMGIHVKASTHSQAQVAALWKNFQTKYKEGKGAVDAGQDLLGSFQDLRSGYRGFLYGNDNKVEQAMRTLRMGDKLLAKGSSLIAILGGKTGLPVSGVLGLVQHARDFLGGVNLESVLSIIPAGLRGPLESTLKSIAGTDLTKLIGSIGGNGSIPTDLLGGLVPGIKDLNSLGLSGALDGVLGSSNPLSQLMGDAGALGPLLGGNEILNEALGEALGGVLGPATGLLGLGAFVPVHETGELLTITRDSNSTLHQSLSTQQEMRQLLYTICMHEKAIRRVQYEMEEKIFIEDRDARKSAAIGVDQYRDGIANLVISKNLIIVNPRDNIQKAQTEKEKVLEGDIIASGNPSAQVIVADLKTVTGLTNTLTDKEKVLAGIPTSPSTPGTGGEATPDSNTDNNASVAKQTHQTSWWGRLTNRFGTLVYAQNADDNQNTDTEPEPSFWDTLVKISEPQNNPVGSFLLAYEAKSRIMNQAEQDARDEYLAGGGILGTKTCIEWADEAKTNCRKWQTDTPGSIIKDSFSGALTSSAKQAAEADAVGENFTVNDLPTSVQRIANARANSQNSAEVPSTYEQPDPCPGPGPCPDSGWQGGGGTPPGTGTSTDDSETDLCPNKPGVQTSILDCFGDDEDDGEDGEPGENGPLVTFNVGTSNLGTGSVFWQTENAEYCQASNDWLSNSTGGTNQLTVIKKKGERLPNTDGALGTTYPLPINIAFSINGEISASAIPSITRDISGYGSVATVVPPTPQASSTYSIRFTAQTIVSDAPTTTFNVINVTAGSASTLSSVINSFVTAINQDPTLNRYTASVATSPSAGLQLKITVKPRYQIECFSSNGESTTKEKTIPPITGGGGETTTNFGPTGRVGATMCINSDGTAGQSASTIFERADTFGPGSIEAPDNHATTHIVERLDSTAGIGAYFAFLAHKTDHDQNGETDRSRIEVKGPTGTRGETYTFTWRFYIEPNMKFSNRFTHLHQIKADDSGGSNPVITIGGVTDSSGNEWLIVENLDNDSEIKKVSMNGLKGVWLDAYEQITYNENGSYSLTIKRPNGSIALQTGTITTQSWRSGRVSMRPKWGVYRGYADILNATEDQVRFANFGITKGATPASACRA